MIFSIIDSLSVAVKNFLLIARLRDESSFNKLSAIQLIIIYNKLSGSIPLFLIGNKVLVKGLF